VTTRSALDIAMAAHAGQTDKADRPYIGHPTRVSAHVSRLYPNCPVGVIETAILHDVLEDTRVGVDDLRERGVSEPVIEAVVALTKVPGESAEDYYARVRENAWARMVKHADITDNTDPERLALLDDETRERLESKYARARELLGVDVPEAVA
jgi:(p)ppGpp synthase/HD superfamily hydrolase